MNEKDIFISLCLENGIKNYDDLFIIRNTSIFKNKIECVVYLDKVKETHKYVVDCVKGHDIFVCWQVKCPNGKMRTHFYVKASDVMNIADTPTTYLLKDLEKRNSDIQETVYVFSSKNMSFKSLRLDNKV